MTDLKMQLHRGACRKNFPVELNRMRFAFLHACPSCGAAYRISEKEAIRAHRLLEQIERVRKCSCCTSGKAMPSSGGTRFGRCSDLPIFPAVIADDLCKAV